MILQAKSCKEGCLTIVQNEITARKVIANVGPLPDQQMKSLADALLSGGISVMEVSFHQADPDSFPRTTDNLRLLREDYPSSLIVGAGNVLTVDQLQLAYEAGAQFAVIPIADRDLIVRGKDLGLTVIAGGFTATEIHAAYAAGADLAMVFPVGSLGPNYLRSLQASLSHIPLLVSGGVNEANADDYRRAGAVAVEVGGKLTGREWIENGQWTDIQALAAMYVKAVD